MTEDAPPPTSAPAVTPPASPVPTAKATVTPPSTPSPAAPTTAPPATGVTLSADGIGPYKFGTSRATVTAYLTKALGKPKTNPKQDGVGQCEGGAGLWGSMEIYGSLRVQYYAKDASSKSPQTLASWTLMQATKPKPPLALAKNIPAGLTMKQLKARYPKQGSMEYMGCWGIDGAPSTFICPSTGAGDLGTVFSGLMDWCT